MRCLVLTLLFLVLAQPAAAQLGPVQLDIEPHREAAQRIIAAATADSSAYDRLAELVDTFPHRMTGTPMLADAIDWLAAQLEADGLENVRLQEFTAPNWQRGAESVTLHGARERDLPMLGLGGSIGTPPEGITAEAVVVRSFEELEARAGEVAGRIVVYNQPWTTYGESVRYRTLGAIEAARHGAVASLVRSVTPYSLQTPHTGMMRYDDEVPLIPHAAITVEDAEYLARKQGRGEPISLTIRMEAERLPDVVTHNVIAELTGRERPEEIVVLGGHIDSWDIGQGAHDDGAGVVVTWEAIRLLNELGLRPRRTVRFIAWSAEEIGLIGARAYRDSLSDEDVANHVLGMESDSGVFAPVGFGVAASDEVIAMLQPIEELIGPLLVESEAHPTGIVRGGGAPDLIPLMEEGIPGVGLNTDNVRYFYTHHTEADTLDKVDPADLAQSIAITAVFIYVVAEMAETLPR